MKYQTKEKNIKQELINIESILQGIEVKGESVMGMFFARRALKELFDDIEAVEEDRVEKKVEV